jgi:hypothetical protein
MSHRTESCDHAFESICYTMDGQACLPEDGNWKAHPSRVHRGVLEATDCHELHWTWRMVWRWWPTNVSVPHVSRDLTVGHPVVTGA